MRGGTGTSMNLKACPWMGGHGLVGCKENFTTLSKIWGLGMQTNQSVRLSVSHIFNLWILVMKESNRFLKTKTK